MLLSLLKTESTFFFEPRSSSHKTEVASPWFDFVDTHVSDAYWRVTLSILTVLSALQAVRCGDATGLSRGVFTLAASKAKIKRLDATALAPWSIAAYLR